MKSLYKFVLGAYTTTISFSAFLVKPYFQPGEYPFEKGKEQRTLIFEMESEDKDVRIMLKNPEEIPCELKCIPSRFNTLFYKTIFKDLEPSKEYTYQIFQKEKMIFESQFKISSENTPLQLTVFGCAGENTEGQKEIAALLKGRPIDAVIYLGDFTYTTQSEKGTVHAGTATAFRQNFFKPYEGIFNKVPFYSVIGNKEMDSANFDTDKDPYAYFNYVCHPLNGPETMPLSILKGTQESIDSFLKHVSHYKKGTNYSVEFCKDGKPLVHLQVVDGNAWIDPSQESLQSWIRKDLEHTKAPWKIACVHQPLASCFYNSELYKGLEMFLGESIKASQKNMITEKNRVRQYAKLWQENGVQLVLSAHLHGYERSKPLELIPKENKLNEEDHFEEKIGKGPVYIITGAAGAHLHSNAQIPEKLRGFLTPELLQQMLDSIESCKEKINLVDYSYSSLKINEKKLVLEQINKENKVIDSFEIKL